MKPRQRRVLHGLLFAALTVVTLVVLFYAEEDWRGARVWAAEQRDLKARGESIDFNDLVPPPVPDDRNLAMAPLFQRLFRYEVDPRTHVLTFNHGGGWYQDANKLMAEMPFGPSKVALARPSFRGWASGHSLDLGIAQRYYQHRPEFPQPAAPQSPADDVLLALMRYAPILDELAQASAERPLTRFPVNYTLDPGWGIALPHYSYIQALVLTLRLRSVALLDAGQVSAARRDIDQILRLRGAMKDDPLLIAALVDTISLNLLLQPVWEGLATRQWSREDLDALRDALSSVNVLGEYQRAMRAERAVMPARWPEDFQDMARAREATENINAPDEVEFGRSGLTLGRWLWRALPYWPRGWYEQNAALSSRCVQDLWIDTVDPARHQVALAQNQERERILREMPVTANTLLVKISLTVLVSITKKFAQAQAAVDQAVIACALEKYYLDHHAYPATLPALTPGYLDRVPNDVIDGAPMRYRLTVDGRYQLYSIGWDGRDGGGAIDWPTDRTRRDTSSGSSSSWDDRGYPSPSRVQGDWVWQYAPAEPPDPPENRTRLESLP